MPVTIKPITKAIIMLTNQCNLKCSYCFESHNSCHMSLETAKQIAQFLSNNCTGHQIAHITFFGGEPMLYFDKTIVPLVEWIQETNLPITYSMTTNGTLLNKENLSFLKDYNIRFMLSFDGVAQDNNRIMKSKKSSYNTILNSWNDIQANQLCSMVRSTVTKDTLSSLYNNIKLMEQLQVKNYHVLPNLWEEWTEQDLAVLQSQLQLYEEYIIENFEENKLPLLFSDYGHSFWRIAATTSVSDRRSNFQCLPENRCGMGVKGSCSIDTHGDIYGCHHITPLTRDSEWYLGNVYDGVDQIRIENLISLYDRKQIGNSDCISCPLDNICDGGCTSTNLMVTGDLNKVPKTYCYWKRAIADSAYKVTQILGKKENQLFKEYFIGRCKNG